MEEGGVIIEMNSEKWRINGGRNNEKFGYKRFHFLYLEDTLTQEQRRQKTLDAIKDFFNM